MSERISHESETALAERRAGSRYPLDFSVSLRALEAGAHARRGHSADMSAQGVYVRCDPGSLAEGVPVEVSVRMPVEGPGPVVNVWGLGRVVRVDRAAGESGVAVSFDRIEYTPDALESLT